MERIITTTADGSKTIHIPDLGESYHSRHGALQEARHVFIKNGLQLLEKNEVNILELGLGTGLNAIATADALLAMEEQVKINYFGVEKYPLNKIETESLKYSELFENKDIKEIETRINTAPWEELVVIFKNFNLKKIQADFYQIEKIDLPKIDLVYFDCFGAAAQPDLWEKPLAEIVSKKMATSGILTTYASKGSFRRILQELGFEVTKRPGPPGKREMITAKKL